MFAGAGWLEQTIEFASILSGNDGVRHGQVLLGADHSRSGKARPRLAQNMRLFVHLFAAASKML